MRYGFIIYTEKNQYTIIVKSKNKLTTKKEMSELVFLESAKKNISEIKAVERVF